MTYQTTPAGIAAALRRAADDIEALGDVELTPISVRVDLQAVRFGGTPDSRVAAVDALSVALSGTPGVTEEDGVHHRSSLDSRESRGDLTFAVYTSRENFRPGGAR